MSRALTAMALRPGVSPYAVAVPFALLVGVLASEPPMTRIAIAGVAAVLAMTVAFVYPRQFLFGLFVWLAALGLVRRIASEFTPAGAADPLLLVAPGGLAALALVAFHRGAYRHTSALTNAVLVLSGLIVLGSLNPLQDSLLSGVSALLFVFVPTLAFWIGRAYCTDDVLERLLKIVGVLAVPIALYGLRQTLVGFPSWDELWIRDRGYSALNVGGVTRAFGSLSSGSEYAYYLAIGLLVWLAFWRRGARLALTVPVAGLLLSGIFLESSRGIVVLLVCTAGIVLAATWGRPLAPSIALGVLAVGLFFWAADRAAPTTLGSGNVAELSGHMLRGFADPLNEDASTLRVHTSLVTGGLQNALENPIGEGIASVTIASETFGGESRGTEADPSNMAVALGVPGLLAYLAVLILGFRRVYGVARRRRDALSLVALAILSVTVVQWLNGGQYAVALLPWLILGWSDRPLSDQQAASS
jgi:hypothetical protein